MIVNKQRTPGNRAVNWCRGITQGRVPSGSAGTHAQVRETPSRAPLSFRTQPNAF